MNKLRVGVAGLGIGRNHLRGYLEHPGAEIVAAADLDPTRREEARSQYAVPLLYASAEEMFAAADLDVVSVCVPNAMHRPIALAAFEAGCHVLCEKPMAMNAAEAEEMLAAAERAGRRLMINFSFRFNSQAVALKKRTEAGLLGQVYFARTAWHRRRGVPGFGGWFGRKELSGGGPLIDLGVHRLDLALWLMGYPEPEWVLANTWNALTAPVAEREGKQFDVEDFAGAMIRFRDGSMLELEASWASNVKENDVMETRLFGTHGGLVHRNRNEDYEFEAEMYFERDGSQFDMQLHEPAPKPKSSMWHFIEAIRTDTPHPAPGEEGLTVQRLLDAIYLSAERGEPIRIMPTEERFGEIPSVDTVSPAI
ncbi:MAG: Gfo/Idh/MocA family oxidoreductase [Planctomycetaceae bacterium]